MIRVMNNAERTLSLHHVVISSQPERSKYRHIKKEEKAVVCWWNRLKAGLTVLVPSSSSLPKESPTRAPSEFCTPERPCLTAKDAQSDSQIFSAASSFPPKSYRKYGAQ